MDDACRNEDGQVEVDALSSGHVSGSQAAPVVTPASSPAARPSLAMWPCLDLKLTIEEFSLPEMSTSEPQLTDKELVGTTEGHAEDPNRHVEGLQGPGKSDCSSIVVLLTLPAPNGRQATSAANSAGGGVNDGDVNEEDTACEVCKKPTPWKTMLLCDQ